MICLCIQCGKFYESEIPKFCSDKCKEDYYKRIKRNKNKYKKSKKICDIEFNGDIWHIHRGKDGRYRAYSKKRCISYPKFLLMTKGIEIENGFDIHHKDENFENNSFENFVIEEHKKHVKYHNPKINLYHDKIMICPICGKEFLWTEKRQRYFMTNKTRKNKGITGKRSNKPFCSKKCAGTYSQKIQMEFNKK